MNWIHNKIFIRYAECGMTTQHHKYWKKINLKLDSSAPPFYNCGKRQMKTFFFFEYSEVHKFLLTRGYLWKNDLKIVLRKFSSERNTNNEGVILIVIQLYLSICLTNHCHIFKKFKIEIQVISKWEVVGEKSENMLKLFSYSEVR